MGNCATQQVAVVGRLTAPSLVTAACCCQAQLAAYDEKLCLDQPDTGDCTHVVFLVPGGLPLLLTVLAPLAFTHHCRGGRAEWGAR